MFLKATIILISLAATPVWADKYKRPTALFVGQDKITGRITSFDVEMGETVQFGTLQITPRVCYDRPPTEAPQTDTFVEIDDVRPDKSLHRIFTGWMFADSPGLHGVEHPVYDVWLKRCQGEGLLIKEAETPAEAAEMPPPPLRSQDGDIDEDR